MASEKKYWFKPKIYGYGFFPISWEGWLLTIVLIGVLTLSAYVNNFFTAEVDVKDGLRFLLDVIILTTLFSVISVHRTKGELKWRWGNKD